MIKEEHKTWARVFEVKAAELYPSVDPSHDVLHIRRVVHLARRLADEEGADWRVVAPAAYFHDMVTVPKNDPRRAQASRLSADAAIAYLSSIGYPPELFHAIAHAIEAHSFSANIAPETLEAKVVQDADRLDSLGAIGIARCFSTSALMARPYYDVSDPFAQARPPDDRAFCIDHFATKLFRIAETLHTAAAQAEAARRVAFMRLYLKEMAQDIGMVDSWA